jgi:crossover junction endodeoxyribonuclease RuvC
MTTHANPLVLGLDIATSLGWARGRVDDPAPACGTIRFGNVRTSAPEIFGNAVRWAEAYIGELKPDILVVEALLPVDAMIGETSRAVRDRLCGLHSIMLGVAHNAGVGEIVTASVSDVRNHFISQRNLKRAQAKAAVMAKCQVLGWSVADDNQGDAAATWSYACALIDPKLALRGSPLFNRIASIW